MQCKMIAFLLLDDSLKLSASLMSSSTVLVEAILVDVNPHHRVYFYPFTGYLASSLSLLLPRFGPRCGLGQ